MTASDQSLARPVTAPAIWRRLRRLFLVVGAIGGLIALLAYGFTRDPRAIPSPLVGRPAPDFTLALLDGGSLTLSALRGRVVVVNFWASWCYPACWNEAPRLEAAWRTYRDRGLVMVGVVYQDSETNAREFIRRFGKSYPNGLDPRSRIAIEYGVYGVPETFFIDRAGRLRWKHVGEMDEATLRAGIEALLAEPSGAGDEAGGHGDTSPAGRAGAPAARPRLRPVRRARFRIARRAHRPLPERGRRRALAGRGVGIEVQAPGRDGHCPAPARPQDHLRGHPRGPGPQDHRRREELAGGQRRARGA